MGGGISRLFSNNPKLHDEELVHPEDVDKSGLLYPGKESFISDELTRWALITAMDFVYEKYEELENSNITERTIVALSQPLASGTDTWNKIKICPTRSYIKACIIDFDPTKKNTENVTVYSYLVQAQYKSDVDSLLEGEIKKIRM